MLILDRLIAFPIFNGIYALGQNLHPGRKIFPAHTRSIECSELWGLNI
jgi:hypothetical protein